MTTRPARGRRDAVLSATGADLVVVAYVVGGIVLDHSSILAQATRVLLVGAALLETARKPVHANAVQLWQFVFVGFAAISVKWSGDPSQAKSMAVTLLINGVCVVALVYLIDGQARRLKIFLVCMMVGPILLMLKVGAQYGFLVFSSSRLVEGVNANIIGLPASFGFCLAYLCFSRRMILSRPTALALMGGDLTVTFLSASRKSIVMIAVVLLLFSWLSRDRAEGSRLPKVLAAAAAAGAGYWAMLNVGPLYNLVGFRMEGMVNGLLGGGQEDASTATRLFLIERGIQWFHEKPWLGHGADNFKHLMLEYYPRQTSFYAHNNYVELLVDLGLVGLFAFYWIYLWIVGKGLLNFSRLTSTQAMMLSLMFGLLFIEYGQVDYYDRTMMAFVGVAWLALCTATIATDDGDGEQRTRARNARPPRGRSVRPPRYGDGRRGFNTSPDAVAER